MKIIILFVIMLNFYIYLPKIKASTHEVKWENTIVNVPIGSNIYEYSLIPVAKLYINDVLQNNQAFYDRNANFSSLEGISTSFIGEFHVFYEVSFENTSIKSQAQITFIIFDDSFPEFNISNDIYVPVYGKYNFENIKCTDKYDGDLEFSYEGNINFNAVGDYLVKFYAKDKSNNETYYNVTFHIYDNIKPTIELLNNKINYGEKNHNFLNDVNIIDNYKLSQNPIFIHDIDFYRCGEYDVTIYVTDDNNNYSFINVKYYVIDSKPPKIVLTQDTITLKKGENVDFKAFIKDVYDNNSILDIENVLIKTNYIDEYGIYYVYYEIEDEFNNVGYNKLKVVVKDDNLPIINVSNKTIKKGEIFDPYKDVFALDYFNNDISYRINYSGFVNVYKVGLYELIYSVYDDFGNYQFKTIYVNVYDDKTQGIKYPDVIENEYENDYYSGAEVKREGKNYKKYIIIVGIILALSITGIIIWRKKKK